MQDTYYVNTNKVSESNKQLLWITDIHEDDCSPETIEYFFKELQLHPAPILLIGGDISHGSSSLDFLLTLQKCTQKKIYFILGNHDFYDESIEEIRCQAQNISKKHPNLCYLSGSIPIALSETTALVGHDGWADGREGDFFHSTISLGDYTLIDDLKNLKGKDLLHKLHELGDQAAEVLGESLEMALKIFSDVILLTHVPPFKEACCYHGTMCDGNWGPHFVCKAVGEKILALTKKYSEKKVLVLCGHSHSYAKVMLSPDLCVVAGETTLGYPKAQASIWYP